ncbi:MAG TPA: putative toxin-antitoxin system toxin component, PIN family [Candidatus Saccharimonadales bacterium]|nr:putative toxin-antitoxin system toxin component, PIN family [Candidatus Saccharimonadales bacterium]
MKAVLDTNVLISSYVFPGGKPEAVYRLALEGRLEIGTSRTLLAEFGRVLDRKFGWSPDRVEAAVAQMTRVASVVEPGETVQVVRADPADDRVLEAARAYGADVIVSGDRHLLDLGAWNEIEIVSPAEFMARWNA